MLRRAITLTTVLVALFFIGRWIFVSGDDAVATSEAATPAPSPAAAGVEPSARPADEQAATDEKAPNGEKSAGDQGQAATVTDTAAVVTASPKAFEAEQGRLASHRAVYELKLGDGRNTSGIAAVDGRMVIEFIDTCDGYALNQRLQMRLSDGEGAANTTDFRVTNWESTDGRRFRFSTRHITNGEEDQAIEGNAALTEDGSGTVDFVKPEAKQETLAPGTIFPTLHTVQMIEAAKAHKPLLTRVLFDGTSDDIGSNLVAVIGRAGDVAPSALKDKGLDLLKGKSSWPVRLAFFGLDSNEELPDYEVGYRLYDNGVSGDMVLDYGDFSINAILSDIEALPRPAC